MPEAREISQGDLYWLRSDDEIPHPHLVVQEDLFNRSRITTVVVCALTSNLKRAELPGNLLLEAGEGGLPKASVVEVGKVASVEKAALGAYIGSLSAARVQQVLAGMRFQQRAYFEK